MHQDKCTIYLYRNEGFLLKERWTPVFLNDRYAGLTYYEGYFLWKVDPGQIVISGSGGLGEVTFRCESGQMYFVRQLTPFFESGDVRFQLVDESEGRDSVRRTKLILGTF